MTGPASVGIERGTGAPSRSTGTQGAVGAVLLVLALGLALRLIIAQMAPGSGFGVDLGAFRFWMEDLAANGLHGFYERDFFHDYTPGYLYVLWLMGTLGNLLQWETWGTAVPSAQFLAELDLKAPAILADLAIGWLVWSMVRELGGRDRLALVAAFVAVMNPVSWFDSVLWGQVDSFGVVFLLLGLRELWRDRPERAAIYTVIAAIIKPQLGILIPIVAVVTIRRALWPPDDSHESGAPRPLTGHGLTARFSAWERDTGHAVRIVTTGLVAIVTVYLICLPFGLSVVQVSTTAPYFTSGLLEQILKTAGGYPYVTVNAYNLWALVASDAGISLANTSFWVCDGPWVATRYCDNGVVTIGAAPAVAVGTALFVGVIGAILAVIWRRPDRLTILLGLTVLAFAFFAVPTRVHERYAYPFFPLAIIIAAVSWRWRIAYVVGSVTIFLNMYVVLTTLYNDNPGVIDWLGIGSAIRTEIGVAVIAIVNGLLALWLIAQLRSSARERLAADLVASTPPPEPERPIPVAVPAGSAGGPVAVALTTGADRAPAGVAGPAAVAVPAIATMPVWRERPTVEDAGVVGWFRGLLETRPIRPDRSRALDSEGGGRLDRLDLWLLVVLVVATMGLRTFRLAEPYQMHFDEVYHARTATEFLQGWRYGIDHDIYEWTHPHLAKYAMAAGLVLWGEDDVSATSELGTPVTATVVEPRRDDPLAGGRAGERLHVATGTEIRTYDLRTRQLIGVMAAPGATALAMSDPGTELVIGFDDGRLATVDVESMGLGGTEVGLTPIELGTGVGTRVDELLALDDGTSLMVASGDRLSTVDIASGDVKAALDLPDVADLAPGGTGAALVGTPSEMDDPSAVAVSLADLIGGDAGAIEAKLLAGTDSVVLGSPGDAETRANVELAISDGTLPGVVISDVTRVAVATSEGVSFVDPASGAIVSTLPETGGAHGLALVTGLGDPKLYATVGGADDPEYDVIAVGGDPAKDGPKSTGRNPLPGPGTDIVYDSATQQVHILGLAPDAGPAGPWTVYVVEPVGDKPAVFADARLPDGFVPVSIATDLEPEYPAEDRQQLLLFTTTGSSASIDVGSHAFAWRFPGVIAGALTAALLFLLTRILFKRRLVAGLVALFVVFDGMFFVQSRIGMNDVYVGLFIIAAYTLFAALWTGWWRGRAVFWLAMPVIGLLLGLALASKWVAAYAIGALILLILIRSALGRVLTLLGMIGLTSVLGYLAITVPEGQGLGNLTFLVIMLALTLIGVVTAIVHPVAWTDEEMRLAVAAPVALGTLVFLGAVATGSANAVITFGPLAVTPLEAALGLALGSVVVAGLFWAAGRVGFGPLASPPAADDSARFLAAPAPAPEGWLRPGWLLGLPVVYAAICLVALPVGVYVVSYIPWALIGQNQLFAGWPAGHEGQTLLDLLGQMYRYHNNLSAAHAASSPWWAWPLNLKPVWFYQEGLALGTSAALYDAGSLVIWWLGIPALAFAGIMAFKRRSLALTLIAVGFAAQWVSWARIDRAAFQYHYYTALPFVVMALAYLMAEIWHGASKRTWQLARLAAALAIMGPALMWLFHRPLCWFVGVESVNPGSQACPAIIPTVVITARTLALAVVVIGGVMLLVRQFLELDEEDGSLDVGRWRSFRPLAMTGVGVAIGLVIAASLPDTPILTLSNISVEPVALVALLPLAYLAIQIIGSRDARRFVIGFGVAAVSWFVILYPNISALPLPSAVVAAYQGILPTYLYAFQFPVSTVDRSVPVPLLTPMFVVLTVAIAVTCLVVAYSTWSWRLAAAEAMDGSSDDADADADALARSGGGA